MTVIKTFTLAQANDLLPELKSMLSAANQDLSDKSEVLAHAYALHENCEDNMSKVKAIKTDGEEEFSALRECRLNFQISIESLTQAKEDYVQALNFWLEEIAQTGVVLRDIKSGLLDFPAASDNFQYYLCWQANEPTIQYWHPINDGFVGRRTLAVLSEYL